VSMTLDVLNPLLTTSSTHSRTEDRQAINACKDRKTCRQTVTDYDRRFYPARPSHLGFLIGSHYPQCLGIPPVK
jgi:hypothetical protein